MRGLRPVESLDLGTPTLRGCVHSLEGDLGAALCEVQPEKLPPGRPPVPAFPERQGRREAGVGAGLCFKLQQGKLRKEPHSKQETSHLVL